ncbi:MAG: AP2 domain-containing protein [Candidatus Pacebacteria bacterium]|nr:AP2 domain-containing protein [Candidatus Paceibacterota bacterium]
MRSDNLKNGNTKSCGCLQKEITKNIGENNKKYNTYDLSGGYGVGYTLKNEEFWFDLNDYDKIKNYCWYKNIDGYLISNTSDKPILLHRLLMEPQPDEVIDHIDHKVYNNQKINLRICNQSQNSCNTLDSINNTSGAKGVCWHEKSNKWLAFIKKNRKQFNLGRFINIDDAILYREIAELYLFKEYSIRYEELKEKYKDINVDEYTKTNMRDIYGLSN